jgi:DNA topoisomerase VI subunit B
MDDDILDGFMSESKHSIFENFATKKDFVAMHKELAKKLRKAKKRKKEEKYFGFNKKNKKIKKMEKRLRDLEIVIDSMSHKKSQSGRWDNLIEKSVLKAIDKIGDIGGIYVKGKLSQKVR